MRESLFFGGAKLGLYMAPQNLAAVAQSHITAPIAQKLWHLICCVVKCTKAHFSICDF